MINKIAPFIISLLLFIITGGIVKSQTPARLPDPYPVNGKVNFVRNWEATAPITDPFEMVLRPAKDVRQTTQYFDGLGRQIQTVTRKASLITNPADPFSATTAKDLVTARTYDSSGRETYLYLPFITDSTRGEFLSNPFQQQVTFYNTRLTGQTGETNVGTGNWAYGKKILEPSPLGRSLSVFEPGVSYVGSENSSTPRKTSMHYWNNTIADSVRIWKMLDTVSKLGSYYTSGIYPAGVLSKEVRVDEHGKQVIEFTNRQGLVVLKKTQLTATADNGTGKNHVGWLCIYYIYDDFSRLRAVIQPAGVEVLDNNGWTITSPLLNHQIFRYSYDGRHRMTQKQTPGAAVVFSIYDQMNRLTFVQDGNLRKKSQWETTLYDDFNRPVVTGLTTWSGTPHALQQYLDTLSGYGPPPSGIPEDLILSRVTESGNYQALNSISLESGFITNDGSDINMEIAPSRVSGVDVSLNPIPPGASFYFLSKTYYDNYDWANTLPASLKDFDSSVASLFPSHDNNNYPYPQAIKKTINSQNQVTGRILRTTDSLKTLISITFYDDNGRAIQTRSENYSGGYDVLTIQYSFSGQPLQQVLQHQKDGANPQTHRITTKMGYDELGRLVTVKKAVNSIIGTVTLDVPEKLILTHEYDALGKLKSKKTGNKPDAQGEPLAKMEYEYNIKGEILSQNKDYLNGSGNNDQYFGLQLGYDKSSEMGSPNPQFNGNVRAVIWKNEGDRQKRKFDFSYDAFNRLTAADFNQHVSGEGSNAIFNKSAGLDFSVDGLTYDANGNILSMNQRGWKGANSGVIDSLRYHYFNYTSLLRNVLDLTNDTASRLGDFNSSASYMTSLGHNKTAAAEDYAYDANGNLVKDLNKNIHDAAYDGIEYNQMNQPVKIRFKNQGLIEYVYDAIGTKISKRVTEGAKVTTTLYIAGFEYENDTLQKIIHEEGYIRLEKATGNTCTLLPLRYVFHYFVKDYIGNVRLVLSEEQKTDCYPAATLEEVRVATEKKIFDIIPGRIVQKNLINTTQASFEDKVYRVHGGLENEKTGLGIVLKVMSGDKLMIRGESYYELPGGNAGSPLPMALTELLASFVTSGAGLNKGVFATADIAGIPGNTVPFNNFLNSNDPGSHTAKAALNWILMDEQFKFTAGDFDGVQIGGGYKNHSKFINSPVIIPKNGYLYVYVSNESNLPVYFDNIQVTHKRSPIVETTDYYPYGLNMAAISSKAAGKQSNRFGYNGKERQENEFSNGSGLNWYDFGARMYDAQTGRWMMQDAAADLMRQYSPYVYSFNNPLRFFDEDGLLPEQVTNGEDPKKLYEKSVQIDMNNAPAKSSLNAQGFKRAGPWFWRQMLEKHPEMFDESNVKAIKRGASPIVNDKWLEFNPTHKAYKDDKLVHHHVDQKNMAVGIPERHHQKYFKDLHDDVGGGRPSVPSGGAKKPIGSGVLSGIKKLGGLAKFLGPITDIFGALSGDPHSLWNQFGGITKNDIGKLKYDATNKLYYDLISVTENKDAAGNVISTHYQFKAYSQYDWDSKLGKYVGVGDSTIYHIYQTPGKRSNTAMEII